MIALLLLTGLLLGPSTTQEPPPDRAAAIALARQERFEEALYQFRRLAAINPNDHDARAWIARLHVWMGHPDQAEEVYRTVLLEDPDNIDALRGFGELLIARHEASEALDVLERAERLTRDDGEVLALLGRAHSATGETTRAL